MNEMDNLLLVVLGVIVVSISLGVIFGKVLLPIIVTEIGITVVEGAVIWLFTGMIVMYIGMVKFNKQVDEQ